MTPLMLMDVWNNLKGVNSYSEFKNKGYNYENAFDKMVERNALVYNGGEALKAFGFEETDITTEKVGEELLEGIWVYFSYKNGYITNIRKAD